MGVNTGISWTDATWNPFYGCSKVSVGCKNCYMYRDQSRYGNNPAVVQKSKTKFNEPLKWHEGKLVFTCSWSDFFIEEGDQYRDELWKIIKATPQHTYQILTKRPERIQQCLPADWGNGYDNVWLGISVENHENYCNRIKYFHAINAKIKFLSFEPLLEMIQLYSDHIGENIFKIAFDWVIIGGESGNLNGKFTARECKIEWIKYIIDQCVRVELPVFVKQLGTHLSYELHLGEKYGADINEWPCSLQKQFFPENRHGRLFQSKHF